MTKPLPYGYLPPDLEPKPHRRGRFNGEMCRMQMQSIEVFLGADVNNIKVRYAIWIWVRKSRTWHAVNWTGKNQK